MDIGVSLHAQGSLFIPQNSEVPFLLVKEDDDWMDKCVKLPQRKIPMAAGRRPASDSELPKTRR